MSDEAEAMGEVQNARFQMVAAARKYVAMLDVADERRARGEPDEDLVERLKLLDALDDAALVFARAVEKNRAFEGVPAWLRALPERRR